MLILPTNLSQINQTNQPTKSIMDHQQMQTLNQFQCYLSRGSREIMAEIICQWTRENYHLIIEELYKKNRTENEETRHLCYLFHNSNIYRSPKLKEMVINSGIIYQHRLSIYIYCCRSLDINMIPFNQIENNYINIFNAEELVERFIFCYSIDFEETMVNKFIEIRDSVVTLK